MTRKELELRYGVLKESCADLVERYNYEATAGRQALEHGFMMAVGRHELTLLQVSVEVRRWKRRFELRQEACNRGETPDYVAIESALDAEFFAFKEELGRRSVAVDKAKAYYCTKTMTEEDSTRMRMFYLDAAKRLHPDLHPDQSEAARKLWLQIGSSYENREWEELEYFVKLIDDVVSEPKSFPGGEEGRRLLEAECQRLEEICREQRERLDALSQRIPWKYAQLLNDVDALASLQRELFEKIAACESRIADFKRKWNMEVNA